MPPIYQPEVAARAILFAATHRRREIWVGGSAAKVILANKLFPGLLDRFLSKSGYSGQIGGPLRPDRPDNLFEPVDREPSGVHGAHGRFDDRARTGSFSLWLTLNRGWLLFGALGLAAWAAIGEAEPKRRRRW